MKNKKAVIGIIILVAILILGIGFALISNVNLNINGEATATPSDTNFAVEFTGTPTTSDEDKVIATITGDLTATMNVSGITAKGDTVTATYTILNTSPDLTADLVASITNSNEEYFNVTSSFTDSSVKAGNTTTITVTVELIKTPITTDVVSDVTVSLTASPVQPE